MSKNYLRTLIAASLCFLSSVHGQANDLSPHLTCYALNIEALDLDRQNGQAFLSWDYGPGGAIDEQTFNVHSVSLADGSTIYLDGTNVKNSKFFLKLKAANGSSKSSLMRGHLVAQTSEAAPITLNTNISCTEKALPREASRSSTHSFNAPSSARACADPNSDAGIAAWDSGRCGTYGGGSN